MTALGAPPATRDSDDRSAPAGVLELVRKFEAIRLEPGRDGDAELRAFCAVRAALIERIAHTPARSLFELGAKARACIHYLEDEDFGPGAEIEFLIVRDAAVFFRQELAGDDPFLERLVQRQAALRTFEGALRLVDAADKALYAARERGDAAGAARAEGDDAHRLEADTCTAERDALGRALETSPITLAGYAALIDLVEELDRKDDLEGTGAVRALVAAARKFTGLST